MDGGWCQKLNIILNVSQHRQWFHGKKKIDVWKLTSIKFAKHKLLFIQTEQTYAILESVYFGVKMQITPDQQFCSRWGLQCISPQCET